MHALSQDSRFALTAPANDRTANDRSPSPAAHHQRSNFARSLSSLAARALPRCLHTFTPKSTLSSITITVETYGGLAHESCQLLRTLASFAPSELGGETGFLAHAYRVISICLQRGNARIDQTLAHRLHVEEVRRGHLSKAGVSRGA